MSIDSVLSCLCKSLSVAEDRLLKKSEMLWKITDINNNHTFTFFQQQFHIHL